MIPTREQAYTILKKYNESDALIKHALCVEAVMRYYVNQYGEDVEYWGAVGLLHDLDYEKYPEEHCKKVFELLEKEDVDEAFIRSISSHGFGLCCDIAPIHRMEKVLYATDELTGLINACALMRPSHSVMDMEVKSVKKKFKQHSFAAGVNREVIQKGAEMLNVTLEDLIAGCIEAMRAVADDIGLGMQQ